jgi:3-hydroxyacyl-CoA dehydrogenase
MAHGIQKVAVLGAGVMGAAIAAHLANAGIPSVLFDIVPPDAEGADRLAFAQKGITTIKKIKPAALYRKDAAALITPANYDDHGHLLGECDWIVEAVIERLDIKQKVFSWVAANRKPDSVVSSNTSGIPLAALVEKMDPELRKHFLVTHFFNPVRYMRLLELVSGPDTDPAVTSRMADFGNTVLGKGIVYGKDTPNFVANRIGTFGMASVFRHIKDYDLPIEAVDSIFGSPMGRPKSAIFRTADVVGLDTLSLVFGTLLEKAAGDECQDWFEVPSYLTELVSSGRTGQKAGAGFYKKSKVDGKRVIKSLNLKTGEYDAPQKLRFPSVGAAKKAGSTAKAMHALVWGDDDAAKLAWSVTADTLIYSANRIPEICDDIVNVDRAMEWGFAWEMGPFRTWDAIGVAESVERMEAEGRVVPAWVKSMLSSGRTQFYQRNEGGTLTHATLAGDSASVPTDPRRLSLQDIRLDRGEVARNTSASLVDLGDGALCLEFHSKVNALDELIFEQYEKGLDLLDEGQFKTLIVGNQDGKAFCAGANILMILMGAMQKEWDQIDGNIKRLQDLLMRAKYSSAPIITAPYALTLGGGCEVAMQSSATVAGGELYMGLVEVGVGLIPGGGGCKEAMFRYLQDIPPTVDYDPIPFVAKAFENIAMAKVSTSVEEARDMAYLRRNDRVVINPDHLLSTAKTLGIGMADSGYEPPKKVKIKLPGPSGRAAIELFLMQMQQGGYATGHDVTIGKKLGHVLTGGDIPANAWVSEQDLLDLEREAFLSLCGEEKTIARIQHMLQTNKPLRN